MTVDYGIALSLGWNKPMHIMQVINHVIPAVKYGGTERVVWWLSEKLAELGHRVTILAPAESSCDFATVLPLDPQKSLDAQAPDDVDIIHLHDDTQPSERTPTIRTFHGNMRKTGSMSENTVFISADQAWRHGGSVFIHHGLALIESLYFGNPVFGTPFGSLPEIVSGEVGFLSKSRNELIGQVRELERFDRWRCHEYACDRFS